MVDINELGFINADGSDYISYLVDMSHWPISPGSALPTLYYMVTWSADGEFLMGLSTLSNRAGGIPILLSANGELTGCPADSSPYGSNRIWNIDNKNVVMRNIHEGDSNVVIFDLATCSIAKILYSVDAPLNEGLREAAISDNEVLAIGHSVRTGSVFVDQISLIAPDGEAYFTIPNASYPAWSNDGEWLVFYSYADGLYIIRKDGTESHKIVDRLETYTRASWSPDGNWIVFDRTINNADGNGSTSIIYKVDVETGEEFELFRGGYNPDWK